MTIITAYELFGLNEVSQGVRGWVAILDNTLSGLLGPVIPVRTGVSGGVSFQIRVFRRR